MNHVTTLFNSNEFGELRTIIIENEVYFVAKSVATALGYKDTSLILKSKMPSAKKFKRWVTSEVLPQIRKTGSYDLHIPKTLPEHTE